MALTRLFTKGPVFEEKRRSYAAELRLTLLRRLFFLYIFICYLYLLNNQRGDKDTPAMSQKSLHSEMKMESRRSRTGNRDRLGLSFTIDYLLFNGGVKGSTVEVTGSSAAEQTEKDTLNHQDPKRQEVEIHCQTSGKQSKKSEAGDDKSNTQEEECDEEQQEEGEEEVTTTTTCTNSDSEKSEDKPNQSYIALISKAILASEVKKLLLCDIYQWIMDHYPYFKSKVRLYQFTGFSYHVRKKSRRLWRQLYCRCEGS